MIITLCSLSTILIIFLVRVLIDYNIIRPITVYIKIVAIYVLLMVKKSLSWYKNMGNIYDEMLFEIYVNQMLENISKGGKSNGGKSNGGKSDSNGNGKNKLHTITKTDI